MNSAREVQWELDPIRVILVRPTIPANIGSTARVMRNFGIRTLRLVRPHADPRDEAARKLSTHGEAILHQAESRPDLTSALADCVLVVGTSARLGGPMRRQNVSTLRELLPEVCRAALRGPIGFVFGPEQTGLTDSEVTLCHYLATIPADETYAALNLSQSVAITLYEWFIHRTGAPDLTLSTPPAIAPFEQQHRMFQRLESALRDVHFLWGENAESLMHALRHLIGRANPTEMEINLLTGLARQIEWFARQNRGPD